MENEKSVGKLGKGKCCLNSIQLKEKTSNDLLIKYLHFSLVSKLSYGGRVMGTGRQCPGQSSFSLGRSAEGPIPVTS